MVDIASLAIQIDTSDVARAESDLERLGTKGAKAEQAAKGVGDAYQQAAGKVGGVAGAASQAGTALERNSVAARENARELASVDRSASSLSGSMSKLGATLAGLTAGMSIKGIIDISDNYGQMADRIKMATASTEEYRMVQERLLQSANRTYRPLAEAQELYIRTADAIRSLGYQTSDALDITDSFSYLLVTNAASADKASNAIDAYSKSIQSGRIEVDSWQSLIAAMPSVVDTLSGSLGKSAEEIRQLGITGKLSLADLNEGLRQTVEQNQKLADGMGTTLNDAIVRASNNLSTYLGESSKVTASSRLLSGALDGVTENIDLIATTLGGVAVAAVARYATVTAKSTAASVAQTIAAGRQAAEELKLAQAQVASATAAVALARANVGLTASTGQVTAALAAQEAAQKRLAAAQSASVGLGRTVLGLAGGWAGLAVTAGAVALSFVDWGDGAEEAARKSIALREETNLLTRAVEDLDAAQAKQVLQRMEEPYQAAKDEARNYAAQIEYLNAQLDRHPGSAKVEEWNRALVDAKGNLSTVNQELATQEAKMRDLNARIEQNTNAWKAQREAASETDKEGQSFLASLQRRADLSGKLTEVQKTQIAIEKGYAGVLSETAKQEALAAAAVIDRANAALNAGKGVAKATDEQARAFKALYDSLYPAEAAQRQYNEQVALLDKYLDGDQLAKAIDRLNHSLEGADATGPGDVIEDYRKELQRLEDQLDPVGKATEQYRKDVERLDDALARGEIGAERHAQLLGELEKQYKQNTNATSDWAKWTEGALDRVDSAFADAWRNIGDGFSSFRDSLTDAFKQMLAELAHMAITRPIVMQIGAALGIGGGTQGNNGIWGSLLGGGSGSGGGGLDFGKLLNYGQTAYSMFTGVGPAALAGYQSGGIMGGLQGAAGYYGNLASSAWGTVSGWFGGSAAAGAGSAAGTGFGLGQSVVSGQIGNAAYAGAQAGVGGNLSGMLGNLGAIVGPIAGLYMAVKGYGAISDGYDFKPKDFDDEFAGVRLGAKVINAYENGITKVFGDSSFLSKALRIPVATIGGLMSSVFGGGWETKNYGLAFSVANGDFLGQSYEDQKKKGGWFSSSKKRTKFRNLDPETAAALQETYDATQAGVADLFASLSLTVEEGSLDGLKLAREKISTKGKTEEEIQQAIAEWFGSAADAMTAELNKVFNTGLDLDLEGMQAFVGNLVGVNEVLRYLDVEMYAASVAGGKLAEALSAAAGGLEVLATNSQTYYGAFFSEAEKVEDTIDSIKRTFESADVELASSRQAYREMVEDIDLTTEAGREMFATMMALSGQAAQYYSIIEQQAAAAAAQAAAAAAQAAANAQLYYDQFTTAPQKIDDALAGIVAQFSAMDVALPATRAGFVAAVDALDTTTEAGKKMFDTLMSVAGAADAYYDILEARAASVSAGTANAAVAASRGALSTLSAAINAEKSSIASAYQAQADSIRSAIGSANDSLSQMRSVASSLRSAVNGLRLESEQYAAQSRRSAQQAIRQALSGGGRLQMTEPLERALGTVSQSSEELFGSFEDYARDYWQTYFAIEQLAERAEDQLSADEQAVKALERQLDQSQRFHDAEIERLDGVLEGANAQLEALLGIDTSVQSVEAALAAFTAALAAAQKLQNANSSITSVTGLAGVKRQVTSEGYLLDEKGALMELFGEAMRVVGNKVVGGAGATLNIGADGQLSWATGDYERWAKQEGIPGFASGGSHRGGLRLVGENGPELEVTGPSRIYNASQTAAMLGGGSETASEVRALRSDFAGMMDALRSVAKHTMQTAKRVEFLERWDFDGLPKERATA